MSQDWSSKFRVAWRGLLGAFASQVSFRVHFVIAATVFVVAAVLKVSTQDWVVLMIMAGLVITTELVNTAFEELTAAVHPQHHEGVGRALDIAAGAVLFASILAVLVGLLVLGPPLTKFLGSSL